MLPRPAHGLLAVALALPLLLRPADADALRGWCARDPQIMIGAEAVHVHVEIDVPDLRTARALSTGPPIGISLAAPHGVPVRFLGGDNGLGAGYDFRSYESGELTAGGEAFPVTVAAYVPLTDPSVAVRVSLVPTASRRSPQARGQGGGPDGNGGPAFLTAGAAVGSADVWVGFTSGAGEPGAVATVAPPRPAQGRNPHGDAGAGGADRRRAAPSGRPPGP